jgi:hypothetical protein
MMEKREKEWLRKRSTQFVADILVRSEQWQNETAKIILPQVLKEKKTEKNDSSQHEALYERVNHVLQEYAKVVKVRESDARKLSVQLVVIDELRMRLREALTK